MRHLLVISAVLALGAAPLAAQGGAAGQDRGRSFSLEDLTSKLSMVESIADVTSWLGPKPDPIPEFNYAEKRQFDMQLNQSLAAGLPIVNVRTDGAFSRGSVPERMSQWLEAVDKSGGQVRYCAVESNDRGIFALIGVAMKLTKKVDKWLLYRPASAYDALVVSDGSEGRVLNIAFTERGAVEGCPEGTADVGADGSADDE